jgi:hypothetical protein
MNHSYEEIRDVSLDLLAGREKSAHELSQYQSLLLNVAAVIQRREGALATVDGRDPQFSQADREQFLEVFWGLFRDGIITLGLNDSNREFPFFRVTGFGRRILEHQQGYFFHDVSSYERVLKAEIPALDEVTLLYLKEAMQAFRAGCLLASTVMLGVATEHTFLLLVERVCGNPAHRIAFAAVAEQYTILQKVNKFKNILDQGYRKLPGPVKEDLDTNFAGILSVIRTFRNQSGHPTGKIMDREQVYVLLQLFVAYAKKMYQLMDYYSATADLTSG